MFENALGARQSYVSKVERGESLKVILALVNLRSILNRNLDYLNLRTADPSRTSPAQATR